MRARVVLHLAAGGELVATRRQRRNRPDTVLAAKRGECRIRFMAAEYDDLPDTVKTEAQAFADVNVAWLTKMLAATSVSGTNCETEARAIFAAVIGAQLMARSRAD